jgi:hypothetical protein
MINDHKSANRAHELNEVEIGMMAQQRGVSTSNSSGLTFGWENGESPAATLHPAPTNALVTASNGKRVAHDAILFSPKRDPFSTVNEAPTAASKQKKNRYVDLTASAGHDGTDDLMGSLLTGLVRNLNAVVPAKPAVQAVVPAEIRVAGPIIANDELLMERLLTKLDRLDKSWKRAKEMGKPDSVDKYSTQIEAVEQEIEDLENAGIVAVRDAENH